MASIQKRGSSFRVRITREGKSTLCATFKNRLDALQWAKKTEAQIALGTLIEPSKPSLKTFGEAAICYRDTHSIHKKIFRSETYRLNILIKRWGPLMIESVDKAAVLALRDDLLRLGRAGDTINHYFNTLSKLFQMLNDEWGLKINNPIKGIKRMPPSQGRTKRLKGKAEDALFEACAALSYPTLHAIIAVALETGMRRSEIMGLTWEDIDLEKRCVSLHKTKNGESRQVPLTRKAVTIIQKQSLERGKVFSMSLEQLRGQFRKAREYARGNWQEYGANPFDDLRFHDLRHEAISRLSDAGLNVIELACISGHKTLGMLRRYTHPAHEAIFSKLDGKMT